MKFWTILALFVVVFAVFSRAEQTEKIDGVENVDENALQDDQNDEDMWVFFNFITRLVGKYDQQIHFETVKSRTVFCKIMHVSFII